MRIFYAFGIAVMAGALSPRVGGQGLDGGRSSVVLEGSAARVIVDLRGGSIASFRLTSSAINPLNWSSPAAGDTAIRGFGHFLCLDRWGPASAAEEAKGMPYHGEAAHVDWLVVSNATRRAGVIEAQLSATLPIAGLLVRRTIAVSADAAVFGVREEVKNANALGRIYNMVQHPTIAPPFLDESTVVDCNGGKGFAQGGSLPNPEEPAFPWPEALRADGTKVDMRRLLDDPRPNVVSYAVGEEYGWVTAATPAKGLLVGYLWKRADYPWVSLWRDVSGGHPSARGLEFGTTGLHQPYPVLVKKGRIWERPLFEYLDAGETVARSYVGFLVRVEPEFKGVSSIQVKEGKLILRERGESGREIAIEAAAVLTVFP